MLDTGLCGSKKEYQSLAIWFSGTQYRDLMLVADTWRTCSLECQCLACWFDSTQYRDLMLVADTWRTCSLECQ